MDKNYFGVDIAYYIDYPETSFGLALYRDEENELQIDHISVEAAKKLIYKMVKAGAKITYDHNPYNVRIFYKEIRLHP